MGTGGSLPNNFQSEEPPPLPPPFYTGNLQSGISRISGSSCESQNPRDDRRTSGTSTVTLGNTGFHQHPRSFGSVKNEEWWHQRPSAPSLSGLRQQQETLLTYGGQMTGWQTGCETSALPTMHQEAMELSRTVSHLAAANQQLATAHTTLLNQLESLYLELNRERQLRFEREQDEEKNTTRQNYRFTNDEQEKSVIGRIENLKATIEEETRSCQLCECPVREANADKIRVRKNSLTKEIGVQSEDPRLDLLEIRLGASSQQLGTNDYKRFGRKEHLEKISSNNERESIESQTDLSLEYRKAVERIESLENALANSHVDVVDYCKGEGNQWDNSKKTKNDKRSVEEREKSVVTRLSKNEQDTRRLLQEIERLNNEALEYREKNEQLGKNYENQVMLSEKLTMDRKFFRSQYEKIESSLNEGKEKFDTLMLEYERAKVEKSRLSKELLEFKLEKNNANEIIANLEKKLADSMLAEKLIANSENQESSRLRKILSDEMRNKREQDRALEQALGEIQRLNEIIEDANKKDQEAAGAIDISENETSQEEGVLDSEIAAVPRSSNMEEFRKELSLKREARQRAIAAVSSEMDRLRRELDAEKEAHSETSRVLDLLKSGQAATNVATKRETNDNDRMSGKNVDLREKNDWRTKMTPDTELSSNEADAQALTDILKVSDELRASIRLQTEKMDDLRYHLECEPEGHKNRITSLKEIAAASREASTIRERQINKLKNLLAQIIARLGDPRFRVEISDDVRAEHDRQLEDIRRLKTLYDDRLRVLADLRDGASKELKDLKEKLKGSRKENSGLEEDLKKAEEKIDTQDTEISNLESQLGLTKADCRDLQNQMSVINGLFTQMLLSASSADMDLDRLTRLLQENHDLISDMAREEGSEAAALPKLLLDLVEQVEGRGGSSKTGDGTSDKKDEGPQEDNIAHNLPKVWRVLLELLSCHAVGGSPPVTPASLSTDPNSCYKSVDTPSGPRLVISVSKTYIRLKELILEKKHLEKEMNRMKQLNTHLESKLGEQEKRLSTVSSELSKTWNVVGRMQAQHQQLHTHEKILRYELQQKRKMLQELKQELEYCREKWESARQKNTNTEIEWRSLRREFAARKSLAAQDSFNNSGESGFSDERGDDSDDEDKAVEERVRIGPRRRARKENPRAPTPDTESEQPTDTEVTETKRESTSEQRTSSSSSSSSSSSEVQPRRTSDSTEQDISTMSTSAATSSSEKSSNEHEIGSENGEQATPMNSVDRALANVIENLITVGEENNEANPSSSVLLKQSENQDTRDMQSCSVQSEMEEEIIIPDDGQNVSEQLSNVNRPLDEIELAKMRCKDISMNDTDTEHACPVSVFSIGPFPTFFTPPPVKSVQFSDPLIVGPSTTQSALSVFGDILQPPEDTNDSMKNEAVKGTNEQTRQKIDDEEEETRKIMQVSIVGCSENCEKSAKSQRDDFPEVTLSSPEDDTATPSTSMAETLTQVPPAKPVRSHEQVLAARAARLKRLEEQADWLMKKMNATSIRGTALSTRLEELHEVYGEAPVPPPLPDVLPNVRIPSEITSANRHQIKEEENTEKGPNDIPGPSDSP